MPCASPKACLHRTPFLLWCSATSHPLTALVLSNIAPPHCSGAHRQVRLGHVVLPICALVTHASDHLTLLPLLIHICRGEEREQFSAGSVLLPLTCNAVASARHCMAS